MDSTALLENCILSAISAAINEGKTAIMIQKSIETQFIIFVKL